MNKRGVIDQAITTVPVFFGIVVIGIIFIVISIGGGFLGRFDLKDSEAKFGDNFAQIGSEVMLNLFINDIVTIDGKEHKIEDVIADLSSLPPELLAENIKLLEKHFIQFYSCSGANSLLLIQYKSSSSNIAYYLIDYPARPLDNAREIPVGAKDLSSEVETFSNGVYPQNIEGKSKGYSSKRIEKSSSDSSWFRATVRGRSKC